MRPPWQLAIGLAIVGVWAVLAVAAPLLTPVDPLRTRTFMQVGTRFIPGPFEPGTFGFPLGSDRQGRDLWVGLMYGARATLAVAGLVLLARLLIGVTIGGVGGWLAGRWPDRLISAVVDAFAAFPTVLFAMLWIFAFDIRSGVTAFAAALSITGWWGFGRATRAALLRLRDRPFLEAARAIGLRESAVFLRHALPNLLPLLAVTAALEAGAILLVLGELGFLGIVVGGGFSVPLDERGGGSVFFFSTPEWGAILAQGRFELFAAPWIALVPAAAYASLIFAFELIGHGLRGLLERSAVALHRLFTLRAGALVLLALVAVQLVLPLVGPGAALADVARGFDGGRAMSHLRFLGDAARGGRWTGSRGFAEAARYVAERFREAGLEPLGDGGAYEQKVTVSTVDLAAMPSFERLAPAPRTFVPRVDYTPQLGSRAAGGDVEGEVVFVGGGMRSADYSDYEGTHPEGNVVLISGPFSADPIDLAIRSGARAAILVADPGRDLIKPSARAQFEKDTIPVLVVSEAVGDELVAASGKRIVDFRVALSDRLRRAQTLPLTRREWRPLSFDTGIRVRISVAVRPIEQIEAANVVGLLRGADPERATKALVVGAHLDGVGTDPDGRVFPAATDNASGVAVLVELARTLAARRDLLRSSVVFVAFAGEEQGLVGSELFVEGSAGGPWRPANVIAFLGIDSVGCCGELAATEERFALRARLAEAADRFGIALGFTRGSSDHLSYVRRRVPAVMLASAELGPIHTERDTVEATGGPERLRAAGLIAAQAVLELAATDR